MKAQEVDLSNLKPGDTVHFRCGGKAVVRRIDQRGDRGAYGKGVFFQNHGGDSFTYNEQGECGQGCGAGPFDIIRVEPAFRLHTRHIGDEFIVNGNYAEYIGICQNQGKHVFWLKGCCNLVLVDEKDVLPTDRTPGHIKAARTDGVSTPTVFRFDIWSRLRLECGTDYGGGIQNDEEEPNTQLAAQEE